MTDLWTVPDGWAWRTFGDVATVASNLVDPAKQPDAAHIAPNHIESGSGILLPYSTVASDGVTSPKHQFRAGQILYSKIRPYLAKVVLVDFDGLCSADMYPIETTLEPRYLKWWLLTPSFTELASSAEGRTVLPKINAKALRLLPVPVPPLAEQRRIVDILEDHLSRLDASRRLVVAARRRAESLVTASLALHARTASGSSTRIGDVSDLVQYGTGAKASVEGDVPVLRMGNVKNGRLDWTSLKYLPASHPDFPKLMLVDGDLLFNRTNSAEHVGKSAVYEDRLAASFASYLIRVRFKPGVDPHWASMMINSPLGRHYVGSVVSQQVGQANVNGAKLKAFPINLPPLAEQRGRVAEHLGLVKDADRLSVALNAAEIRSQSLRRALLAAGFSGRLTGHPSDLTRAEQFASVSA